jgi:hydrogenase 3 maturation protease
VVEAGPAPENCTGPIRRFTPDLVILVDAADMEEAPGTVRWLDWQEATGLSASTHSLPLSFFARYLTTESGAAVALLGIQPQQIDFGTRLSDPVRRAVRRVVDGLSALLLLP